MKKILLFLFISFITCPLFAANYYLDATSGNDGNLGTSTSAPWQTIAELESNALSAGDNVYFKRGEVWREQLDIGYSGSEGSPITFDAYDSGDDPIISGGSIITTFADEGGNVWSKGSITTEPKVVVLDGVRGYNETAQVNLNAQGEWFWSSNTLYIYSTSDPDVAYSTIEIGARNDCVDITSQDFINVNNIQFELSNLNGIDINGTSKNIQFDNCYLRFSGNDGFNVHDNCMNASIRNSIIEYNGSTRNEPSLAPGDGISLHESSTGIFEYNIIRYNDKAGIDQVGNSSTINRYNVLYGNYDQIKIGISTLPCTGTHLVSYNVIYDSFDSTTNGVESYGNGCDAEIYNNTIYSGDETGNAGIIINDSSSSESYEVKNNIVVGFTSGLYSTNGTMTNDYNDIYDNTTNFDVGVSQATNDISSDPVFTSAATNDFTLQSTSPCIEAGVYVDIEEDIDGVQVSIPPEMGAYEYESPIYSVLDGNIEIDGNLVIN